MLEGGKNGELLFNRLEFVWDDEKVIMLYNIVNEATASQLYI